jgi:hypothetical protein
MPLDNFWFARPDVEKFVRILEKLGYEWDIVDLQEKPTLRIWKPYKKTSMKNVKITEREGFYW